MALHHDSLPRLKAINLELFTGVDFRLKIRLHNLGGAPTQVESVLVAVDSSCKGPIQWNVSDEPVSIGSGETKILEVSHGDPPETYMTDMAQPEALIWVLVKPVRGISAVKTTWISKGRSYHMADDYEAQRKHFEEYMERHRI